LRTTGPEAQPPDPDKLRSWQRFVSENLEFRLGVAIGAVVAQSWSDGAEDALAVPSLAVWRETTKLPWFGFWAKELLRWGTLDPFVAFAMAQGLAKTRDEGANQRREYDAWLQGTVEDAGVEALIDPQRFLEWQRSLRGRVRIRPTQEVHEVKLTGTDGKLRKYNVIPVLEDDGINWIDASGYSLASVV